MSNDPQYVANLEKENQEMKQEMQKIKKTDDKKGGGSAFYFDGDENEERGNWSGKFDFILSCLGYAVGLGNVWRFPYLCYKNGGGAFLIPYVIALFFMGMPIFLLELSLGQFTSSGPLTCWQFANIFKGVGIGMTVVSGLVGMYYNVIIAWAFWYLFASFASPLPWAKCGSWASYTCEDNFKLMACDTANYTKHMNGTCISNDLKRVVGYYDEAIIKKNNISSSLRAKDYADYVGLQTGLSAGMHDLGMPRWDMTLCLLLAWIVVAASLIKGIKSSGKVVYFTALFPYVVLIILFINGMTLEGKEKGIDFYMKPDLSKLTDGNVWKDAVVQIFFSLSASWGGLIALASYNRFKNDVVRDTIIVSISNCATSVFAGFVVFSYLGHFSFKSGVPVGDIATSGAELAFVVYPQAVLTLPVAPLWAILFFVMLITLGLDSEFALIETVVTGISDQFPRTRKYKWAVVCTIAVVGFLLGLSMTTPGGPYMLTLMDDYSGGWNIMVIAIIECVSVSLVYGVLRFTNDIQVMIDKYACCCMPWRIFRWWWIMNWVVITPLIMLAVMIFSWYSYSGTKYGSYVYPVWANALGWLMTFLVIVCVFIPMFIIPFMDKRGRSIGEKIRNVSRPSKYWGPDLVKHRQLITYVPGFDVDPYNTATRDGDKDFGSPSVNYAYSGEKF